MKARLRFLAWLGAGTALSAVTAPNFIPLFSQLLGDQFGDVFPVFPFAALVVLITALRWKELAEVLDSEDGAKSEWRTRASGVSTLLALLVLEPLTGQTVTTAGVALVLTFYAAALAINPLTKRLLLPYAAVFAAGVGSPSVLQWAFGEPLAVVSSWLSAKLVAIVGLPVAWAGTQFQFVSRSGDVISSFVAPGCSSIISVTTFLGLLALMHLDMRKELRSTALVAIAGTCILTVLNSVRILVLMWVGYEQGAAAFWGVHNWVGYVLFLAFYLAVLPVYSRMGGGGSGPYSVNTGVPYTPS
ncbi:MAG: exosortase/archaeosortase family protein [Nitrososphaerota archaeon]|nr:exosortase/archaeosortase family protein [Nitrososphaerota archaeon]MDG7024555.1 exosortase/archaeosortase family protein [Nitrososphaerota archaeon]